MFSKTFQQLAVFSILVTSVSAAEAPVGSAAPDFTIKDQYDQELQLSSQRGKAILLIYGDNHGSDYMGTWAAAVRESAAATSVKVTRIANLRAVPALLRSYVKRQFLKTNAEGKPNSPVLLDWEGGVAKTYGFTDDLTNVYLIDEAGILRYRACGKGTPEETRKLLDAIADLRQTQ